MLRSHTARSDGRDQTMTTTPDLFTPATEGPSAKGRNGKTPAGKRNGNGKTSYDESMIRTLSSLEHIRLRTGMYIGRLGDGSDLDDGIYVLLKEVLDNCIDEFVMGFGKTIEVECDGQTVIVRDFGRGIPLAKLMDCASKINTGAKYDTEAFKKSVGLNGVGIKAVNALSEQFDIQAFREGKTRRVEFTRGKVVSKFVE